MEISAYKVSAHLNRGTGGAVEAFVFFLDMFDITFLGLNTFGKLITAQA